MSASPAVPDGTYYRPEGWADHDPALSGWNIDSIVAFRRADWPALIAPTQCTAPLGEGHDHNNALSFAYVLGLTARGRKRVSILDWGGALAHYYRVACALYPQLELEYTCKEVPSIADLGRELNPQVRFVVEAQEALARRYDLVFVCASLQYEQDWRSLLGSLARATQRYLFITRTPVVLGGPSFVVVQRDSLYGAAYQSWCIGLEELMDAFGDARLELIREFAVLEPHAVPGAPAPTRMRGFLLQPTV